MTLSGATSAPTRVSGPSALTWSRIFRAVGAGGAVFSVMAAVVGQFLPTSVQPAVSTTFFITVGTSAVLGIVGLSGVPNAERERRAGYTTLQRTYAEVSQVDPRTGEIVRMAGQPYLTKTAAGPYGDTVGGVSRPSLFRRIAFSALTGLGPFVVLTTLYWTSKDAFGIPRSVVGFIILGAVIVFTTAIALGSLGPRRTLRRLNAAAPGEFAFTFSSSSPLALALRAIPPAEATPDTELQEISEATASESGLTFWRGRQPQRVAYLPWSRVASVQYEDTWIHASPQRRVVVSLRKPDSDEIVMLPLAHADGTYLRARSAGEVRWIAAELEQLRTTKSSARVL